MRDVPRASSRKQRLKQNMGGELVIGEPVRKNCLVYQHFNQQFGLCSPVCTLRDRMSIDADSGTVVSPLPKRQSRLVPPFLESWLQGPTAL